MDSIKWLTSRLKCFVLRRDKVLKFTTEEQCVRHVENSGKVEMNFNIFKN